MWNGQDLYYMSDAGPNHRLNIWRWNAANDRLVILSPELEVLGTVGGEAYGFDGPRYLDFDAAGRLYVADKYANRIKVLAPDGRLIFTLGSGRRALGPGVTGYRHAR